MYITISVYRYMIIECCNGRDGKSHWRQSIAGEGGMRKCTAH